ncbi:TRPM2 [Branchiostoma lanceolatum]|uniref:TRPM2 protein n=1 Tax=Branchiostoma lanceolatum TaxID=7740 RepID=A0A8J9W4P8_BRALA|nr:TRPM2 [Branchiostoma lanceolatum]
MTKHWELKLPDLIISITGGERKFFLKRRLKNIFRIGRVKASQSIGTWIITAGMNQCVMKYVGEAIRHSDIIARYKQRKMCAIGIATWGTVDSRESLGAGLFPAKYREDALRRGENMATLDPNHTHFILVDDGTTGKFRGADVKARTRLEEYIMEQMTGEGRQDLKIPVVLLVVQGGEKTLKNVKKAVEKKIPVVIVDGSGQAADLIAYGIKLSRKYDESLLYSHHKPLEEEEMGRRLMSTFELEYEFDRSYPRKAQKLLDQLKCILNDLTLVTVFDLRLEDAKDIDKALLHVLLKANKSYPEYQLKLAMAFNQCDIARQEIFTAERRKIWQQIKMEDAMERALELGKAEFVELLHDRGVDLNKFLTVQRLRNLYMQYCGANVKLLKQLEGRRWCPFLATILPSCCCCCGHEERRVLRLVDKVICNTLLVGQISTLYSDEKYLKSTTHVDNPMQHLLLWAVMMNRRELALLFWRMGEDHVASALTASKVLKSLAEIADSKKKLQLSLDLSNHANEFEELACGVIKECYEMDKKRTRDLLVRRQKNWGNMACMAIAYSSDHLKFMSQDACQSKLNQLWMGEMALDTSWWKLILSTFLPFVIFFIRFVNHEDKPSYSTKKYVPRAKPYVSCFSQRKDEQQQQGKHLFIAGFKSIRKFQLAPVTEFMYTAVFHVAFLVAFSIFILTDLHPLEEKPIGIPEWLTIAYQATLFLEEGRQVITQSPKNLFNKVRIWYSDAYWNRLDRGLLVTFMLSMMLRGVSAGPWFEVLRAMYCLNLGFSFFRLAQLFMANKVIGPKVIMIMKMLLDLAFFLIFFALFIFAYGVMRHALIFPNSLLDWSLLRDVVLIPYWQLYGELFVDLTDGTIPHAPWHAYVVQVLYMLVTNVLLLNLLIAMFSFTFQKIQDHSEQYWRFHNYGLVYEFFDRSWGAPPLIILGHVWRLGKWLIVRRCGTKPPGSNAFNFIFDDRDVRRQRALEEAGAENYLLKKRQRLEKVLDDLDDIKQSVQDMVKKQPA